jgi:aspartate aminotransferase-like enzyme
MIDSMRVPVPTLYPEAVLRAHSQQMINHHIAGIYTITESITKNIKAIFRVKNSVFLLTGAGTWGAGNPLR